MHNAQSYENCSSIHSANEIEPFQPVRPVPVPTHKLNHQFSEKGILSIRRYHRSLTGSFRPVTSVSESSTGFGGDTHGCQIR